MQETEVCSSAFSKGLIFEVVVVVVVSSSTFCLQSEVLESHKIKRRKTEEEGTVV